MEARLEARLVSLALLALLAGCATGQGQTTATRQERVEQAQEQSAQALERARQAQQEAIRAQQAANEAQGRVTEQERRLAEARREVTEREQRLAEARLQARQLATEALQAQQQARQESERAQAEAARAQQRALALQRNQVTVTGEVAAVGPNLIILRGPEPRPLRLVVGEQTTVNIDGVRASVDELQPGTEVRATYQIVNGQPVAVSIETPTQMR